MGPLRDLFWMWLIEATNLDKEDHNNDDNGNGNRNNNYSSASEGGTCSKHTTYSSVDKILPERIHVHAVNLRLGTKLRSNGTSEREAEVGIDNEGTEYYLVRIVASKVLATCHLYIVYHSFMDEAVWWLMGRWWLCRRHHHRHRTVRKGTY